VCIQRGRPDLTHPYVGYEDNLYDVNLECIQTSYRAYFSEDQRTKCMNICDAEMDACRETIEWGFGKTGNIFKIGRDPDNFKFGMKKPVSANYHTKVLPF
jgi:hypothetical protein